MTKINQRGQRKAITLPAGMMQNEFGHTIRGPEPLYGSRAIRRAAAALKKKRMKEGKKK